MQWNDTPFWLAFGLLGQGAFFSRFLVQWIASEKMGRSYIPMSFWYLSVVGSVMLLIYAAHRREPVFLLGYLPNAFVYLRNIVLIKRQGLDHSPSGTAEPHGGPAGTS